MCPNIRFTDWPWLQWYPPLVTTVERWPDPGLSLAEWYTFRKVISVSSDPSSRVAAVECLYSDDDTHMRNSNTSARCVGSISRFQSWIDRHLGSIQCEVSPQQRDLLNSDNKLGYWEGDSSGWNSTTDLVTKKMSNGHWNHLAISENKLLLPDIGI